MAFWHGFDVVPKNRFSGLLFHYEKPRRDVMEQGATPVNRSSLRCFFIRRSDLRVLAFL